MEKTSKDTPSRRARDNERPLVEDIRLLGRILGDVIREQEGVDAYELVEQVRGGKGPIILEAMTYRYRGHSMSDPAKYRTKEEVQEMRERHDPIEQLKAVILKQKIASENELKEIDKEARNSANEAAKFAQDSPEPDPAELWTDVLVEA